MIELSEFKGQAKIGGTAYAVTFAEGSLTIAGLSTKAALAVLQALEVGSSPMIAVEDIHTATAEVLGDTSPEARRRAKDVNFAAVYGTSVAPQTAPEPVPAEKPKVRKTVVNDSPVAAALSKASAEGKLPEAAKPKAEKAEPKPVEEPAAAKAEPKPEPKPEPAPAAEEKPASTGWGLNPAGPDDEEDEELAAERAPIDAENLPGELLSANKVRDVIVYLQDRGYTTIEQIVPVCERIKDKVPALKKIGDIRDRVTRTFSMFQGA